MLSLPRQPNLLRCKSCGHEDFLPADDLPGDEAAEEPAQQSSEDRLDELRIQRQVTLRRATYRSNSHAVIAAIVCVVAAVRLGEMTFHAWRGRSWLLVAAYATIGLVCGLGAIYISHRAIELHHEMRREVTSADPNQERTPS